MKCQKSEKMCLRWLLDFSSVYSVPNQTVNYYLTPLQLLRAYIR